MITFNERVCSCEYRPTEDLSHVTFQYSKSEAQCKILLIFLVGQDELALPVLIADWDKLIFLARFVAVVIKIKMRYSNVSMVDLQLHCSLLGHS